MRERVNQTIATKERSLARVLSLEAGISSRLSAPDALSSMLEDVTLWEWSLMGGFASSTPLALVHKLLDRKEIRSAGVTSWAAWNLMWSSSLIRRRLRLTFCSRLPRPWPHRPVLLPKHNDVNVDALRCHVAVALVVVVPIPTYHSNDGCSKHNVPL
jgi:hypothetical protein